VLKERDGDVKIWDRALKNRDRKTPPDRTIMKKRDERSKPRDGVMKSRDRPMKLWDRDAGAGRKIGDRLGAEGGVEKKKGRP